MKNGITVHTIIRNEDRYIWFAINSVIKFVDEILIFDTGSTDKTIQIINSIKSPKIRFEKKGQVNSREMVKLRQEQINLTKTTWFFILDGDEVWWERSIKAMSEKALSSQEELWGIVTPTINCVGDIYHYQEEKAGKYEFAGRKGHLAVRAIRRTIPGLYIDGNYPLEGYKDKSGKLITDYDKHLTYVDKPYLHLTNLSRSTQENEKVIAREKKYELGIPFAQNFNYPEVFYSDYPNIVPSPWVKLNKAEKIRASIETPLKKLKRKIIK